MMNEHHMYGQKTRFYLPSVPPNTFFLNIEIKLYCRVPTEFQLNRLFCENLIHSDRQNPNHVITVFSIGRLSRILDGCR